MRTMQSKYGILLHFPPSSYELLQIGLHPSHGFTGRLNSTQAGLISAQTCYILLVVFLDQSILHILFPDEKVYSII